MKKFLMIAILLPSIFLGGCQMFRVQATCGPDTCAIEASDESLSIDIEKGDVGVGATIEY